MGKQESGEEMNQSMRMEQVERKDESDIGMSNKLVSTIKGLPITKAEPMDFNPRWMLAITSDSSRYWIHPESGTVLSIR